MSVDPALEAARKSDDPDAFMALVTTKLAYESLVALSLERPKESAPIGPRVLASIVGVKKPSAIIARILGNGVVWGYDVSLGAKHLLAFPSVTPGWIRDGIVHDIGKALRQAGAEQLLADTTMQNAWTKLRPPGTPAHFAPDRVALEAAATLAFDAPLRAIMAGGKREGDEARVILVSVAASKERWTEVDELSLGANKPKKAEAVARGLVSAGWTRTRHPPEALEASRRFVDEIGARLARALPFVAEKERRRLTAAARDIELAVQRADEDSTVKVLVDRIVRSPPREHGDALKELERLVDEDPAAVETLLPALDLVPEDARYYVANLKFRAVTKRNDVEGLRTLLADAECVGEGAYTRICLATRLGPGMARYLDVIAPFLDHPGAEIRRESAEFLARCVETDGSAISAWANQVIRCCVDSERGPSPPVEHLATRALVAALARTKDHAAFVEAAKTVYAAASPRRQTELRSMLRKLFPEGLATLPKKTVPRPPLENEASFLASVHAALADDAPRLVYADALLEAGDPRGEHIILQCQRARTGAMPTWREYELERLHEPAWLGPLDAVLSQHGRRFERGFLVAATWKASTKPEDESAARGHPLWRTVTDLDVTRARDPKAAQRVWRG